MPDSCSVIGCKNRRKKGDGISFFRLPCVNDERRRLWIAALKMENWPWKKLANVKVCSEHFISGQKSIHPKDIDYVPSIFNYQTHRSSKRKKKKKRRDKRKKSRRDRTPSESVSEEAEVDEEAWVQVEADVDEEAWVQVEADGKAAAWKRVKTAGEEDAWVKVKSDMEEGSGKELAHVEVQAGVEEVMEIEEETEMEERTEMEEQPEMEEEDWVGVKEELEQLVEVAEGAGIEEEAGREGVAEVVKEARMEVEAGEAQLNEDVTSPRAMPSGTTQPMIAPNNNSNHDWSAAMTNLDIFVIQIYCCKLCQNKFTSLSQPDIVAHMKKVHGAKWKAACDEVKSRENKGVPTANDGNRTPCRKGDKKKMIKSALKEACVKGASESTKCTIGSSDTVSTLNNNSTTITTSKSHIMDVCATGSSDNVDILKNNSTSPKSPIVNLTKPQRLPNFPSLSFKHGLITVNRVKQPDINISPNIKKIMPSGMTQPMIAPNSTSNHDWSAAMINLDIFLNQIYCCKLCQNKFTSLSQPDIIDHMTEVHEAQWKAAAMTNLDIFIIDTYCCKLCQNKFTSLSRPVIVAHMKEVHEAKWTAACDQVKSRENKCVPTANDGNQTPRRKGDMKKMMKSALKEACVKGTSESTCTTGSSDTVSILNNNSTTFTTSKSPIMNVCATGNSDNVDILKNNSTSPKSSIVNLTKPQSVPNFPYLSFKHGLTIVSGVKQPDVNINPNIKKATQVQSKGQTVTTYVIKKKDIICKHCGHRCRNMQDYWTHCHKKHLLTDVVYYFCPVCKLNCKNAHSLQKHQRLNKECNASQTSHVNLKEGEKT